MLVLPRCTCGELARASDLSRQEGDGEASHPSPVGLRLSTQEKKPFSASFSLRIS